mmetsp:Transcript_61383/g.164874  ORF Transcript_61383/g.164874 Transcript_61383/m.164874 type:complete len:153 (-) Transcript_61383:106-564(-)
MATAMERPTPPPPPRQFVRRGLRLPTRESAAHQREGQRPEQAASERRDQENETFIRTCPRSPHRIAHNHTIANWMNEELRASAESGDQRGNHRADFDELFCGSVIEIVRLSLIPSEEVENVRCILDELDAPVETLDGLSMPMMNSRIGVESF